MKEFAEQNWTWLFPLLMACATGMCFLTADIIIKLKLLHNKKFLRAALISQAALSIPYLILMFSLSEDARAEPFKVILGTVGGYIFGAGLLAFWIYVGRLPSRRASAESIALQPDEPTTLIHNERTKLFANALDRASTACLTVGFATPAAAYLYDIGEFRAHISSAQIALAIPIWFGGCFGFHALARRVLGGLRG